MTIFFPTYIKSFIPSSLQWTFSRHSSIKGLVWQTTCC